MKKRLLLFLTLTFALFSAITTLPALLPLSANPLFSSAPLFAQAKLLSLTINEDIEPGPDSIFLTATGIYADGTSRQMESGISWLSSNKEIAEISASGHLRFSGKGGPLTITVYTSGVSGRRTLNVVPWPTDIKIETSLVKSENPYRLMLLAKLSDGTTRYLGSEDRVLWSTSNPWTAWINSQGVVTFTGENGYVAIKAVVGTLADSVNTTVSDGSEDTVWRKAIRIKEEIKYSKTPLQLSLVAVLANEREEKIEGSSADWSSSDQEIAQVSSEGVVTFSGKPGFTTIKAAYGGYYYQQVVSVGRFLESLCINQTLNYTSFWDGVLLPLSVTAHYNDGTKIIQSTGFVWSTTNKDVADINADGVLTFTGKPGTVVIDVKGAGSEETVQEDSVTVVVPEGDKPQPMRLHIVTKPIYSDLPLQLQAFCAYSDGSLRDVTELAEWVSSTPETASFFQDKLYLSPHSGPVQIRAVFMGLTDTVSASNPNHSKMPARVSQLRIKENFIAYSYLPAEITAIALMGDGRSMDVTAKISWQSSQPLVAKVAKGKLVFGGRIGTAVISASGFGLRDEISLQVSPLDLQPQVEKLVISGDLAKGASQLALEAHYNDGTVVDVTDAAVWNSSNKNIAAVNDSGLVMFVKGFGPVVITAHFGGQEARLERD